MKTTEHSDKSAHPHRRVAWFADGVSALGLAAVAVSGLLSVASGSSYGALMVAALLGASIGSACMLLGLKYGTPRINGVRRVLLAVGLLAVLYSLLALASMILSCIGASEASCCYGRV